MLYILNCLTILGEISKVCLFLGLFFIFWLVAASTAPCLPGSLFASGTPALFPRAEFLSGFRGDLDGAVSSFELVAPCLFELTSLVAALLDLVDCRVCIFAPLCCWLELLSVVSTPLRATAPAFIGAGASADFDPRYCLLLVVACVRQPPIAWFNTV